MRGEDDRSWVVSSDRSSYKDRFIVVSYNILGDENASKHTDLCEFVDTDNLDWNIRKRRICTELRRYKPSIICLQEVDQFDDLAAILHKDGFVGAYKVFSLATGKHRISKIWCETTLLIFVF